MTGASGFTPAAQFKVSNAFESCSVHWGLPAMRAFCEVFSFLSSFIHDIQTVQNIGSEATGRPMTGGISMTSGYERQFTRGQRLVQQRSEGGSKSSLMLPSAIPSCRSNSCGCEGWHLEGNKKKSIENISNEMLNLSKGYLTCFLPKRFVQPEFSYSSVY